MWNCVLSLFSQLGFLVNYGKSSLIPSHTVELIGAVVSARACQCLLASRQVLVSSVCHKQFADETDYDSPYVSGAFWLHVGVHLCDNACQISPVVLTTLASSSRQLMNTVLPQALQVLICWHDPLNVWKGVTFSVPSLIMALIMDASGTGWGTHLNHLQMHWVT